MAKKKITLKTANGQDSLYPRTAASQVEVTANTTLDSYMKGMVDSISDGTTVVVKEAKKVSKSLKIKNAAGTSVTFDGSAELDLSAGVDYATKAGSADSATNADKLENTSKQSIINAAASKAVDDVGTTLSNSYYTKTEIDGKLQGVGKIDAATTGGAGIVRLATQEEVNSGEVTENIPEGGNPDEPPAVVVTPMTLAKKLENYATPTDVANEVAKIVAGADKDFDTLKEIADWILNDTTGAASMANDIATLKGDVETAETDIAGIKTKNESQDKSLQNLDSNKADKSVVKTLQDEVSGIKTTTNDNAASLNRIIGTGIPDTDYGDNNNTQSVALAIRAIGDDEGKQISTTYAKTADLDNKLDKTGKAASATTADSATKATKDGNDNVITTTYATKTELNGKYTKPSTGIPKSDLASAVQTSLGKADTALQSHQDISGKLDITTAANTYLSKTDASNTYALKTELINLTYTVDGTVTY